MRIFFKSPKFFASTVGALCLTATQAPAHADMTGQGGFEHAFLNTDHCLGLVAMGILTATLMLTRKKFFAVAGNIVLLSFLVYQAFLHVLAEGVLGAAEFFVAASLITLISWRSTYWLVQFSNRALDMLKPIVHNYLNRINVRVGFPEVKAHCDIPCKIYDPAIALISTLSVIRLIDIINDTQASADKSSEGYQNTMARSIQRKEEESENLKREIRIIWGDYFKEPQFKEHPEIHELTHQIMLLASGAKQNVNRDDALKLLESVNQFAEIFWATKDVETERKVSPYPPSLEVVRPK